MRLCNVNYASKDGTAKGFTILPSPIERGAVFQHKGKRLRIDEARKSEVPLMQVEADVTVVA